MLALILELELVSHKEWTKTATTVRGEPSLNVVEYHSEYIVLDEPTVGSCI